MMNGDSSKTLVEAIPPFTQKKETKPGAPSCVPQQGGAPTFVLAVITMDPSRRTVSLLSVAPTMTIRNSPKTLVEAIPPLIQKNKKQNRVPHSAVLSRVGGLVEARASQQRIAIKSFLVS